MPGPNRQRSRASHARHRTRPGDDAHYELIAVAARGFRPPRFLSTVPVPDEDHIDPEEEQGYEGAPADLVRPVPTRGRDEPGVGRALRHLPARGQSPGRRHAPRDGCLQRLLHRRPPARGRRAPERPSGFTARTGAGGEAALSRCAAIPCRVRGRRAGGIESAARGAALRQPVRRSGGGTRRPGGSGIAVWTPVICTGESRSGGGVLCRKGQVDAEGAGPALPRRSTSLSMKATCPLTSLCPARPAGIHSARSTSGNS